MALNLGANQYAGPTYSNKVCLMTVGDISTYYCQHRQSGRQAGREAMSMNGLFLNVYGFINNLIVYFLKEFFFFSGRRCCKHNFVTRERLWSIPIKMSFLKFFVNRSSHKYNKKRYTYETLDWHTNIKCNIPIHCYCVIIYILKLMTWCILITILIYFCVFCCFWNI